MTRARELLRTRLTRRGLALSAAALTAALSQASAAAPATLVGATVQSIAPGGVVSARIDEPAEPSSPKNVRGNLDGKPFGDTAQIELDTRAREPDGVMLGVEEHIAIVDERPHGRELGGRRDVRVLVVEAP